MHRATHDQQPRVEQRRCVGTPSTAVTVTAPGGRFVTSQSPSRRQTVTPLPETPLQCRGCALGCWEARVLHPITVVRTFVRTSPSEPQLRSSVNRALRRRRAAVVGIRTCRHRPHSPQHHRRGPGEEQHHFRDMQQGAVTCSRVLSSCGGEGREGPVCGSQEASRMRKSLAASMLQQLRRLRRARIDAAAKAMTNPASTTATISMAVNLTAPRSLR